MPDTYQRNASVIPWENVHSLTDTVPASLWPRSPLEIRFGIIELRDSTYAANECLVRLRTHQFEGSSGLETT